MNIEREGSSPNRSLTTDLRWKIVHFKNQGLSGHEVSEIVDKSPSTCNRIYKKYLETGTVDDRSRTGRPSKRTQESEERLLTEIEANPSLSLSALSEEFKVNFSKLQHSESFRTMCLGVG